MAHNHLCISRKKFINPDHRSYFAGIKRLACHGRKRGSHWQAYYDRANAFTNQGNFDKAISDYNEAIRLVRHYADAYGKKGILERAISNFTEAICPDTNNASAYYNRGLAYSKRRNLNKANADFATAKRLEAGQ